MRAHENVPVALGRECLSSLRMGASAGLLLGAIEAVNISAEELGLLRGSFRAIVPASAMALMILLFALTATSGWRRSGSVRLSLLASVWSAVVGMALACAYGVALAAANRVDRAGALANALDNAATHLLAAPVLALAVGGVAIVVTLHSHTLARRTLFLFTLCELFLFGLGVTALVFAASLQRSARPPFVMGGMLAAAVALASTPAFVLSLRRSKP